MHMHYLRTMAGLHKSRSNVRLAQSQGCLRLFNPHFSLPILSLVDRKNCEECIVRKREEKGRRERWDLNPPPLASQGSALPLYYGRATACGTGNELLSNIKNNTLTRSVLFVL